MPERYAVEFVLRARVIVYLPALAPHTVAIHIAIHHLLPRHATVRTDTLELRLLFFLIIAVPFIALTIIPPLPFILLLSLRAYLFTNHFLLNLHLLIYCS